MDHDRNFKILKSRFSTLPENVTKLLDQLTAEQMDELGEALFTFNTLDDLQDWLTQRQEPLRLSSG